MCFPKILNVKLTNNSYYIGTPPAQVTDFKCRGYDFQNMKCDFTLPENKVNTEYKLFYSTVFAKEKECSLQNDIQTNKKICDLQYDYRPVVCCYDFRIIANNSLGALSQTITLDIHSNIVPAKPIVEVQNLQTNSVTLSLRVDKFFHYQFTNGLMYKIHLKSENLESFFIEGLLLKKDFKTEIKDLKYSYHRYDYSVRVKTVKSNPNDETMWSEPFEGYFITKPKRPERPPKINAGSFYIDSAKETIQIYWDELAKHEENGQGFFYNFTEVWQDGKLVSPPILTMDKSSALLTYKNTSYYTFHLKSQNQYGTSPNASVIHVNPRINESQRVITKFYHLQNQTYTIMWSRPNDLINLMNFTLVYCAAKLESKTECVGKVNFKNLPKDTLTYTTSSSDNQAMNFALSENYENYSTGMIWSICVPESEPKLTRLSVGNSTISDENTITLQWTPECWYSAILKEINLKYCIVGAENDEHCISEIERRSISASKRSYTIEGLQSSTTYKIWIRMISQDEDGPASIYFATTAGNGYTKIVIVFALITLFVISSLWIVHEYLKMKKIKIKIPDGLIEHEIINSQTKTNGHLTKAFKTIDVRRMKAGNTYPNMPQNYNSNKNAKNKKEMLTQHSIVELLPTTVKIDEPSTVEEQAKNLKNTDSSFNGYITPSAHAILNELSSEYVTKKKLDTSQSLKFLWFFLLILGLGTSPTSANDYVGEVIPQHVELPIGGSVNITCSMNRSYFEDKNSSCLSFTRNQGNIMVAKEYIHVVDNSSIIFMVRNATEQKDRYTCKCDDKGVDVTKIFVGTPPTNVTDFQCRGYDFSYLTCNFTVPENKIYTDYKLKFSTSSPNYVYPCKLENGIQPSERICNITMENNSYRIIYQYYNFTLTACNILGCLNQSIIIDQHNRIVPARPIVEVGNLTTNSVTLYWMVTKFSQYSHTDGLQYEIRLRPEKFDWFSINTNRVLEKNEKDFKAEINNLQFSNRRYDFSVRVKTVRANSSDETMWSEPCVGFFYTKAKKPERAPNMDVGSFYIDPTEQNIRIYWQQLAEYEENGPGFIYNITEVRRDGTIINAIPFQNDSTSATYEWEKTSNYQFKVQSQNEVGKSINTSVLEVHRSRKRSLQMEQIQVITKVYHNQKYTITWRQPSDMDSLRNFTLFWCISKMESQSECKGTINFKHFDKYTTNHTTEPQNHTINFAVSANYDTYSTGMMWATCTADGARDLTKMDPETTPISSHSIKVQWSTECLYMAILEGYNLTYCKVDNHAPEIIGDCINTEKTISISKLSKEYIITDLEPFTTYKISILMYSKLKVGPMSNPVIETTTEDAPSPPRRLKKFNVTSDSVTLSWLPPKHSNGHLRFYTVWYKNEGIVVNNTSSDNESEITFQLGSLSSFSDYKVYVTAHTVKKSEPSNDIHFTTLIGIPSPPVSFNMNRNDSQLFLTWLPPKLPSGRVEFYEVRVMVSKNNESEILKTSRVVGRSCKMNIPCYDPKNYYVLEVRAVNVAGRNEVDFHTFTKRDTNKSYFNSLHQGALKKRRHSNAEINASIGSSYQIHETTEKNLRHRDERDNMNYFPISDEVQEDNNDDFICIGGEKEVANILSKRKDSKFFYSTWQSGLSFACNETKFSKLTLLALVVIIVTMFMLSTAYYARKKYKKMSSIGLVIPEGLHESMHVSKGVDNKIEHDNIIRNDELFYEKENHRLLSKVGNDSGFLNSVHCLDKTSGYACSDLQDSEKSSQSTDSVELNDITSCSYTSSPSHSPNVNLKDAPIPEDRIDPPVVSQLSVHKRPTDNGYIKPIMMSNGYVHPQAFQNLQPKETPSFNGYTTLDAMGKPIFPQASTVNAAPATADINSYQIIEPMKNNVNNKDIPMPQPVSGNICGYVTHKQLSDFGQRLQ